MSLDTSSILSAISAMEQQLAALRAQLGGGSVVASSPAKTTTEKKPRKKSDAPPSAWRLFADRVRALLGANGYSGKALGTECVQFCSSLKEENSDFSSWADADILARRAAWTVPEVSKAEAKFGPGWVKNKAWRKTPTGSVVSGDGDGECARCRFNSCSIDGPWSGCHAVGGNGGRVGPASTATAAASARATEPGPPASTGSRGTAVGRTGPLVP